MADDALFKQKAPQVMRKLIDDFELKDFQAAGVFGNMRIHWANIALSAYTGQ